MNGQERRSKLQGQRGEQKARAENCWGLSVAITDNTRQGLPYPGMENLGMGKGWDPPYPPAEHPLPASHRDWNAYGCRVVVAGKENFSALNPTTSPRETKYIRALGKRQLCFGKTGRRAPQHSNPLSGQQEGK